MSLQNMFIFRENYKSLYNAKLKENIFEKKIKFLLVNIRNFILKLARLEIYIVVVFVRYSQTFDVTMQYVEANLLRTSSITLN